MTQKQSRLTSVIPVNRPFRCFLVRFDNSKRHGRYPVQHHEAYGVEFPEGEVAINTRVQRIGYMSMTDMMETLSGYGNVEVQELGEVNG